VLFEHVHLRTHEQLAEFKARLLDRKYVGGRSAGQLVRSLHVDVSFKHSDSESDDSDNEDSDSDRSDSDSSDSDDEDADECSAMEDAILFALLQTSNLRKCKLGRHNPVSHAALSCLATLSAATLTTLDCHIRPYVDGVMPVINACQGLRVLCLRVLSGTWMHSPAHTLSISGLLHVFWSYDAHDDRLVRFIAQCWFGPRCTFELHMPNLRASKTAPLLQMLQLHACDKLLLSVPPRCLRALAPAIKQASAVTLFYSVPPPGTLVTVPRELKLHYPVGGGQGGERDELWAFLDRFTDSMGGAAQTPPQATVRIYRNAAEFDWLARADTAATVFVGRLLVVAVALYKCGVVVRDVHGRDVTSLTRG
jgi:hypothetical protein